MDSKKMVNLLEGVSSHLDIMIAILQEDGEVTPEERNACETVFARDKLITELSEQRDQLQEENAEAVGSAMHKVDSLKDEIDRLLGANERAANNRIKLQDENSQLLIDIGRERDDNADLKEKLDNVSLEAACREIVEGSPAARRWCYDLEKVKLMVYYLCKYENKFHTVARMEANRNWYDFRSGDLLLNAPDCFAEILIPATGVEVKNESPFTNTSP